MKRVSLHILAFLLFGTLHTVEAQTVFSAIDDGMYAKYILRLRYTSEEPLNSTYVTSYIERPTYVYESTARNEVDAYVYSGGTSLGIFEVQGGSVTRLYDQIPTRVVIRARTMTRTTATYVGQGGGESTDTGERFGPWTEQEIIIPNFGNYNEEFYALKGSSDAGGANFYLTVAKEPQLSAPLDVSLCGVSVPPLTGEYVGPLHSYNILNEAGAPAPGNAPRNDNGSGTVNFTGLRLSPGEKYRLQINYGVAGQSYVRIFTFKAPSAITITQTLPNEGPTCAGGDGKIVLDGISDGSGGPYKISVVPSGSTDPAAESYVSIGGFPLTINRATGNYDVWIMDRRGCMAKAGPVQIVPAYQPITVSLPAENVIHPYCDGRPDGSLTFNISGGNGKTYEYALNGSNTFILIPASAGLWRINELPEGTYSFDFRNPGCDADKKNITQSLTHGNGAPVVTVGGTSDPLCYGETGKVTFWISGSSPYGYEAAIDGQAYSAISVNGGRWTATGLSSADHKFAFKIAGCNPSTSVSQTIAPVPSEISATVESVIRFGTYQISCHGGNDGQVIVSSLSGGTAPAGFTDYTVSLNKNGTYLLSTINGSEQTVVFNNLDAGAYTLEIKDKSSCLRSIPVIVSEPELVSVASVAKKDETCKDAGDGEISASFAGGTGSYTVRFWVDGNERTDTYLQEIILTNSNSLRLENISPGAYKLGIKDSNGCPDNWRVSGTISIGAPTSPLSFSYDAISPQTQLYVTCKNDANGSVNAIAHGGWGGYQYSTDGIAYSANGPSHLFGNLAAGDQTFYLKDASGCAKQYTVKIAEPVVGLELTYSSVQPTCPDKDDGAITVSGTGGWGDLKFSPDGSGYYADAATPGSYTFEGFVDGVYNVYVRDGKGCVRTSSVTIQDRPELLISLTNTVDITCSGNNTGEIALTIAGGTLPYGISTLNTTTAATATGLSSPVIGQLFAGNYTVTVKDAVGCEKVLSDILISEPEPLAITVNEIVSPSRCDESDGSIKTTISGGSAQYILEWSKEAVVISNAKDLNNVPSGNYRLLVKDQLDNTCSLEKIIGIADLFSPGIDVVDLKQVTCDGGSDGAIAISVSDAAAPFVVSWSNGISGLVNNDIPAGIYTAEVKDSKNCVAVREIVVETKPILQVQSVSQESPSCPRDTDGSLQINVINAQGGFTIDWSADAFDGQTTLSPIPAGVYTVVVRDDEGCRAGKSFTINDPLPVSISTRQQSVLKCFNDCDGRIEVSASGGSGTYEFDWTHAAWNETRSGATMTELCAGLYALKVRDTKGCEASRTYTLLNPLQIGVTPVVKEPTCFDYDDGSIVANVINGKSPFVYTWQYDGWQSEVISTENTVDNLHAGTYHLTITDSDGCERASSITLNNPEKIEIGFEPKIYLCGGESISLNAGYPGSTYAWHSNKGFEAKGQIVTIGEPASYTVQVTSPKGCIGKHEFEIINSNELMKANFILSSSAVIGDTVVVIDITNPAPNQIEWDVTGEPEKLQEEDSYYQEFKYYQPGDYEVTLYAYKGQCMDAVTKTITIYPSQEALDQGRKGLGYEGITLEYFNLHPNPNDGKFHVSIHFNQKSPVKLSLIPMNQLQSPQVFLGADQNEYEFDVTVENKSSGMYVLYLEAGEIRDAVKVIVH